MGLISDMVSIVETLKEIVIGGFDDGGEDDRLLMGDVREEPSGFRNLRDKNGSVFVPVGDDGQSQWDEIKLYDEDEYDDGFDVKIKTHLEEIENGKGQ